MKISKREEQKIYKQAERIMNILKKKTKELEKLYKKRNELNGKIAALEFDIDYIEGRAD